MPLVLWVLCIAAALLVMAFVWAFCCAAGRADDASERYANERGAK
jgi:hypothetical protein